MSSIPELPTAVSDALDDNQVHRLVVDRRGSAVWEALMHGTGRAVKVGYPIQAHGEWPAQPWTALAPGREGAVLDRLGAPDIAYGQWEHGTWNIQPWREGPDLYRLWEPCRAADSSVRPHTSVALGCAEALAELHAAGWAHGDVQPAHFIVGPERTHIIDLALAGGAEIPEPYDFPFRGCLVHYEAPEISRSVLDSGEARQTQSADIYAFGASLLISATGWRAVEYPDDAPRPVQRKAVTEHRFREVDIAGPMRSIVRHMLSPAPENRPTILEVLKELNALP